MSEQLRTVAVFLSHDAADPAACALEAAGINVYLHDANIVRLDWLQGRAFGGIKLRIEEEQADDAAELLEGDVEIGEVEGEPSLDPLDVCPFCGAAAAERAMKWPLFMVFSVALLGTGIAIGATEAAFMIVLALLLLVIIWQPRRCGACGERWS